MTSEQLDLKKALDDYFERFCASTTFLDRLRQEGGWDPYFTQRVLNEYKKFLFIVKAGGHPVTPSPKIDKAWHIHLLYTESYWNDLCAKVLGMPLHHTPGSGVPTQEDMFKKDFNATLASYRKFFGSFPQDIWRQEPKQQPVPITPLVVVAIIFGLLGLVFWCSMLPKNFSDAFFAVVIVVWVTITSLIIFALIANRHKLGKRGCGSSCSNDQCGNADTGSGGGESGGFSGGGGESAGGGAGGSSCGSSCGGGNSCGGGGGGH